MREGDKLPDGLKVTWTKGYLEPVYMCDCKRMQTAIAEEAAEHIGWRKIQGEWKCPLCTGNNKNLMKAFDSLTNE